MKFLLLAALSFAVAAPAQARGFYSLGIKVESHFAADSEQKIEGSGILVRSGNPQSFFVLTSEHVVLPANGPAIHRVLVNNNWVDAEWVRSDWEQGLALLRLKEIPAFIQSEADKFVSFSHLVNRKDYGSETYLDILYKNDDRYKGARTFGVPAGSYSVRFSSYGAGVKVLPPGEVLARSRVWSFRNIPTEAGMSGGPVFYGEVVLNGSPEAPAFFDHDGFVYYNHFLGLMTHITYSKELPTYVIPAAVIEAWMQSPGKPVLGRGPKEFNSLYYGRDNPEIVVAEGTSQRLIKVKGQFWITAPVEGADFGAVDSVYPGLAKIGREMLKDGRRSVRVTAIGVEELDNSSPLARFAKLLTVNEALTLAK